MKQAKVLVTDVDNTLFDWFGVWHASFSAMLSRLEEITGKCQEEFFPEIREIHQKNGTSEYSLLLSQMPSLISIYGEENVLDAVEPAISAFRQARRRELRLYDGVFETLQEIKASGALIVAYTESQAFYTNYRFRKLNLDGLIDILYSPPDHDFPDEVTRLSIRSRPTRDYEFRHTQHRFTPKGELKPNPQLLLDILNDCNVGKDSAVYVGDSLFKDIAMAKDAGVADYYAQYGASHSKNEYQLLVNVTHWSDEDVAREKKISERTIEPTTTLSKSFSQLNDLIEWVPYDG